MAGARQGRLGPRLAVIGPAETGCWADDRLEPCQAVSLPPVSGDGFIVIDMTAFAINPFATSPVPILPPDTTPAAIRDALIDEERAEFERAYQQAMAEATQTLDLTRVLDVLRNYHRIAWLTQRQGPEAHRRMLDHVAHALRTGEAPLGSMSAKDIKALIQKRLAK